MIGKYKKKKVQQIRKLQSRKKLQKTIRRYRENPVLFCEEMLGIKLYSWQKVYLRLINKLKKEGMSK